MKTIQLYTHEQFGDIRAVEKDGEVWFVAKEICNVLGITNYRNSTAKLDDDEKGVQVMDTHGGSQEMTIINESGLYKILFTSIKSEAKKFKKWVTSEVIPAIRKHGAYLTDKKIEEFLSSPDTIIKLATDLKVERERTKQLETKIEADKPKMVFAESVETSKTSILIRGFVKYLRQNGHNIGEKRFFEWLRQNGYLIKFGRAKNTPTQKSME
jgi:anti-repressor protein